jgi:hypothetical protein
MAIDVPSIPGDADSATMHKSSGVICPQLHRTKDGVFECLIHPQKEAGHPALAECKAWSGARLGTLQLTTKTIEWIRRPPNIEAADMILDQTRRGLFRTFTIETSLQDCIEVATYYLMRLNVCPEEIFELFDVRAFFQNAYGTSPYLHFDRMLWQHSEELYCAFFHEYVWEGVSPSERLRGSYADRLLHSLV